MSNKPDSRDDLQPRVIRTVGAERSMVMAKRKGESHGVTTVAEPIAPAPMTVIGNCNLSGGHKSNCLQNRVLSINETSKGWEETDTRRHRRSVPLRFCFSGKRLCGRPACVYNVGGITGGRV